MTDADLDREWKPSTRPQSTMARSFSLALNDLFKIDNSIADLDAAVSEQKQKVSSQTSELEALEARLKATEERLKAASSSRPAITNPISGRSSPRPRAPISDTTFSQQPPVSEHTTSPPAAEFGSQVQSVRSESIGSGRSFTGKNVSERPGTGKSERSATGRSERERPQSAWRQGSMSREGIPAALMPGGLPPTPGSSEDGTDYAEETAPPPPPKDLASYAD